MIHPENCQPQARSALKDIRVDEEEDDDDEEGITKRFFHTTLPKKN